MREPAALLRALGNCVVGQRAALEAVVLALLAGGHALVEGPPGVAKTLIATSIGALLKATFSRIQFTADLLPSDVLGARVFDQRDASFKTITGPIFANVVLADEINRAPARVQSALLEAMQEEHVTIGVERLALPRPFFVLATMNPREHEGTYGISAAQLDRFLVSAFAPIPPANDELAILERFIDGAQADQPVASIEDWHRWHARLQMVFVHERIRRYIVALIAATRTAGDGVVEYGAGPRACLALARAARARAFLHGRHCTVPDDVLATAAMVIAHRIGFTDSACMDAQRRQEWISAKLASVPAP